MDTKMLTVAFIDTKFGNTCSWVSLNLDIISGYNMKKFFAIIEK